MALSELFLAVRPELVSPLGAALVIQNLQ